MNKPKPPTEPHYVEAMKTGGWRVLRKRNTLRVALFTDTGADEWWARKFAAEVSGEFFSGELCGNPS